MYLQALVTPVTSLFFHKHNEPANLQPTNLCLHARWGSGGPSSENKHLAADIDSVYSDGLSIYQWLDAKEM